MAAPPELGDAEIEVVLQAINGEVPALLRSRVVNTTWRRVCALPAVWAAVRWPRRLAISDDALLQVLRLTAGSAHTLDFSAGDEEVADEGMIRAPSELCWEWSLPDLRAGLSSTTFARAVRSSAAHLLDLRLSWGGISAGDGDMLLAIAQCSSLTRLDLADCCLSESHVPLLSQTLSKTTSLRHLDLCSNEFSQAYDRLDLTPCSHLCWLGLSMTGMSVALSSISKLAGLTVLLLGGNSLARVPAALRGLRHLAELDLGSNQLYHLPAWITELTTLRVLLLRSLSHRHAPRALDAEHHDGASALPNLSGLALVELDLSDTDLWDCTLPAWLWTMDTLESLDLSDNHLTCLPQGAGLLVRLTTLSLHQQIPWGGSEENLVLGGGGAEALVPPPLWDAEVRASVVAAQASLQAGSASFSLPNTLGGLRLLSKLTMDGTRVLDWPELVEEGEHAGQAAAVKRSGGTKVPHYGSGGVMVGLEYLSVTDARLRTVPRFVSLLPRLHTLNLSCNEVAVLPGCLSRLSSLTYFSVAHNALCCVPAVIGRLHELRELHCAHNRILAVAPEVYTLSVLAVLDVSMNPMQLPDAPTPSGHWVPPPGARFRSGAGALEGVGAGDGEAGEASVSVEAQYSCGATMFVWGMAAVCAETRQLLDSSGSGGLQSEGDPAREHPLEAIGACQHPMPRLERAVLGDTGLGWLPGWLLNPAPAHTLRHLSLGGNRRITALPEELTRLQQLSLLACSACALEGAVPDCVVALTRLEWLSLDRNRLVSLPRALAGLTRLRRLELHDNRLTQAHVNPLRSMSWLRYLSLHGNAGVVAGIPGRVLMDAYLDGDVLPLLALLPLSPVLDADPAE